VYAFAFKSKIHCGSTFEPGASGLPYYYTPPVCVPDIIGALAVWRQNTQKKKRLRGLRVGGFHASNSLGLPHTHSLFVGLFFFEFVSSVFAFFSTCLSLSVSRAALRSVPYS